MRIGFVGAHRTGKTTLARAVAEALGLEVAESQVSAIARNYGFLMDNDRRDRPEFFEMQKHILRHLESNVRGRDAFVADRTPLDAAAYLIADVQANTGSEQWQDEVLQYVDSAVRMTEDLFDVVILVPPAIDFDPMDGKPGANLAYQEHHHLICRGLHADLDQDKVAVGRILRENLDLGDRTSAVVDFVRNAERAAARHQMLVDAAKLFAA